MLNEPTQARLSTLVSGLGVAHQRRQTLALALARAVRERTELNALESLVRGEVAQD